MNRKSMVYRMSILGLLIALIALFWYGIGTINLGFIAITVSCLPVIIGTMVLGLREGLILGLCFGTFSFLAGLTRPQGLIAPVFAAHVLYGVILCYVPRLLVPVITAMVYRSVRNKKQKILLALPAAAGSLTNTVFFLGFLIILYGLIGIENPELLSLVGTTVLVGGLPEAAFAAIVCPPVLLALNKSHLLYQK